MSTCNFSNLSCIKFKLWSSTLQTITLRNIKVVFQTRTYCFSNYLVLNENQYPLISDFIHSLMLLLNFKGCFIIILSDAKYSILMTTYLPLKYFPLVLHVILMFTKITFNEHSNCKCTLFASSLVKYSLKALSII